MSHSNPRVNDVYRYGKSEWCRHGIVRIVEKFEQLYALDTYWLDPNHGAQPIDKVLAEGKYLGNLDDFRKSHPEECDRYRDEDVIHIPIGGGSEQYWLRRDAKPDPLRIARQLAYLIDRADWKMMVAQRDKQRFLNELTPLLKVGMQDVCILATMSDEEMKNYVRCDQEPSDAGAQGE